MAGFIEYQRIVELSRDSGRGGMSRITYVGALMGLERSLIWMGIILLLVFMVLGTNLRASSSLVNLSRLLGLWSLLLLAYIAAIAALIGSWADLKYFRGILQKQSYTADQVYHRAAMLVVRLTKFFILTGISLVFLSIYLISPIIGTRLVGIATTVGLFSFSVLLLIWIPKQLIDYFFLFAALLGRDRTMASNSIALVKHNLEVINVFSPQVPAKDLLLELADSDLRHAEVLLEWINLTVTIAAIIISIIFTDRLLSSYNRFYEATKSTFQTFGTQVSELTQLPYADTISTGILLALILFSINFLLGFLSLLIRTVLRYYFEVYRPAYALRQALMIYFDTPVNPLLAPLPVPDLTPSNEMDRLQ